MASDPKDLMKLSRILAAYGGPGAILRSFYFWGAIVLLVPTWSQWSNPKWWDTVFSVTPSLLGFTLGGFALMLALGDERFRDLIARAGDKKSGASVMEQLSATFLIFILIQASGLILAVVCKGLWESKWIIWAVPPQIGVAFWAASYFLFLYGILLSLAAAKWIYMLATAFSIHIRGRSPSAPNQCPHTSDNLNNELPKSPDK